MSDTHPFKAGDRVRLAEIDSGAESVAAGSVGTVLHDGPSYPEVRWDDDADALLMDPDCLELA